MSTRNAAKLLFQTPLVIATVNIYNRINNSNNICFVDNKPIGYITQYPT